MGDWDGVGGHGGGGGYCTVFLRCCTLNALAFPPSSSSFVRQLNFYGFRKVKFTDSLRIDYELEAATAGFWRFRHAKFRRGRKDLLREIKRTPSAAAAVDAARAAATCAPTAAPPTRTPKGPPVVALGVAARGTASPWAAPHLVAELQELRQKIAAVTEDVAEVQELKQKVASMTAHINQLTGMVQASAGNGRMASPIASWSHGTMPNQEHKKANSLVPAQSGGTSHLVPHWHPSSAGLVGAPPFLLGSDQPSTEPAMASLTYPSPLSDDNGYVDDLFKAFAEDCPLSPGAEGTLGGGQTSPGYVEYTKINNHEPRPEYGKTRDNRPCPGLMQRIEDSLAFIPRDMHEIVARRLIDAISETGPIAATAGALLSAPTELAVSGDEESVAPSLPSPARPSSGVGSPVASVPPLLLPAATLQAILAQYGNALESKSDAPLTTTGWRNRCPRH